MVGMIGARIWYCGIPSVDLWNFYTVPQFSLLEGTGVPFLFIG